ncbi:hypothetical protein [Cellulomonas iranensis]|nr:hypothetical protein [Cellulomonas iranensis]
MASRGSRGPDVPAGGGPDHGAAPRPTRRGTSDPRAARARELHRKAAEADEVAARYRQERDRLVLQLRAEDPARWSYSAIADALGCSPELVALVVRRSR